MLHTEIDNKIIEATKNKEQVRLTVLRSLKNEFLKYEHGGNSVPLNQDIENKIILKMISSMKDSIEQFTNGGRKDLADAEQEQLTILEEFAPIQCSEEEIISYTKTSIDAYVKLMGSNYKISMKDMKPILEAVQHTCPNADGRLVAKVLKEEMAK